MDPLPNIDKAYSMINRIERQNDLKPNKFVEITSFSIDHKTTDVANYSRDKGETSKGGRFKKQNKDHLFCTNCHEYRHTKDECFQLVGYPYWWTGPRVTPIVKPATTPAYKTSNHVNQAEVQVERRSNHGA